MKMMTRRSFLSLSAATAAALGISFLPVETAEACFAIPDAQNLLEEAYLYAFPLVIMNATKIYSTNTETANNIRAPINQFNHARKLADASFRTVVTPNVDTIYTQAWLDLSEEPMIYVVPATDRFFNVQVLDAWTNTAAVLEEPLRLAGNASRRCPEDRSSYNDRLDDRPYRSLWNRRPAECLCDPGADAADAAIDVYIGQLCTSEGQLCTGK